jgi:hypothetical protein
MELELRRGRRGVAAYYLNGRPLANGQPLAVRSGALRLDGAFHWSGVEGEAPRLRGEAGRGVPIAFDVAITTGARCARPQRRSSLSGTGS